MDIRRWLDDVNIEYVNPQIESVFCVTETDAWEIRESQAEFTEMVHVTKGSCFYHVDGLRYIVSEGEFLLIPRGSTRMALSDPERPTGCFAVSARFLDVAGNDLALPAALISRIGPDEPLLRLYADLNLEWTQRMPGFYMKCRALLLLILHRYFAVLAQRNYPERHDPRVNLAVEHIVLHYARPLRVADLAALTGLNPVYFGTLFRNGTGLAIKAFINRVRINNAETLIAGGGYSVEEAARRCGFDDVFYFSKVFKRQMGYPPSQIRPKRNPNTHGKPMP